MYKIYFHTTDSIEVYSGNLVRPETTETLERPPLEAYAHSPVKPFFEDAIDMNSALVKHPEHTIFGKVKNNMFAYQGIYAGDLLIIDKHIEPLDGHLVFCLTDHGYEVNRVLAGQEDALWLVGDSESEESVKLNKESRPSIIGVIVYQVRKR